MCIREWPDPGDPWRRALAADRSGAMDIRGVPHHDRQADAQPGAARHGLSQAVGPPAPSDAELAAHGALRKIADGPHPCRISLTDAAPGDEVILVNYEHHAVEGIV